MDHGSHLANMDLNLVKAVAWLKTKQDMSIFTQLYMSL